MRRAASNPVSQEVAWGVIEFVLSVTDWQKLLQENGSQFWSLYYPEGYCPEGIISPIAT